MRLLHYIKSFFLKRDDCLRHTYTYVSSDREERAVQYAGQGPRRAINQSAL